MFSCLCWEECLLNSTIEIVIKKMWVGKNDENDRKCNMCSLSVCSGKENKMTWKAPSDKYCFTVICYGTHSCWNRGTGWGSMNHTTGCYRYAHKCMLQGAENDVSEAFHCHINIASASSLILCKDTCYSGSAAVDYTFGKYICWGNINIIFIILVVKYQ